MTMQNSTETATAATAVTRTTPASNLVARRWKASLLRSTMRKAANMSSPASEDCGMNWANGANSNTVPATATAENTPDHWLTAPACWLIAERVSDPEPGMHWKK